MSRYFIKLSYRGAPFHGWQIQPSDISVQEVVESALLKICRFPVPITGAGRTDTGVNARMMIAHFDLPEQILPDASFLRSLDALVGPDIAIHSITEVHPDAHARFDASSRTYRYFVTLTKSPFLYPLSWKASPGLDFDLMNSAALRLTDISDFASFAKLHSDNKTTLCKVTHASWHKWDSFGYYFEISADRFLRNMVRAVVGTLIEVGRGKISLDDFNKIIESRDRCMAGTSMPPQALFLWNVGYPYFDSELSVYNPEKL